MDFDISQTACILVELVLGETDACTCAIAKNVSAGFEPCEPVGQTPTMMTAFFLIWISLFAAPPLAFVVFVALGKAQSAAIKVCAAWLGLILLAQAFQLSLSITILNVAAVALSYFAFCMLAVACWKIPNIWLRILAIGATAIPICAGYLLATIGFLGLAFIIADETEPPSHQEQIRPGLTCSITLWGMAASDDGYTVRLLAYSPLLPFVQHEIRRIVVNETHPGPGPVSMTCPEAAALEARAGKRF